MQGVKANLLNQAHNLRTYPLVAQLLASGELKISLWIYEVKTTNILEWNEIQQDFIYITGAAATN